MFRKTRILSLTLFLWSFSTHAQTVNEGRDLGADYTHIQEQIDNPAMAMVLSKELEGLKKYKILVVSGFFSNILKWVPGGQYLDDQKKFLETELNWREGEDYEFVTLNSQGSVNENFPNVSLAIKSSKRDVIIMAHSKGGLDALKAMVKDTSLLKKVAGFIPLQTPFAGTPMVRPFMEVPLLSHAIKFGLSLFGGGAETLQDLSEEKNRKRWREKYREEVDLILKEVKVLSIATWIPHTVIPNTPIPFRSLFFEKGCENDGMIPKASAIFPGSNYVILPEVDHAALIMNTLKNLDRGRMFKSILLLFLRSLHLN